MAEYIVEACILYCIAVMEKKPVNKSFLNEFIASCVTERNCISAEVGKMFYRLILIKISNVCFKPRAQVKSVAK